MVRSRLADPRLAALRPAKGGISRHGPLGNRKPLEGPALLGADWEIRFGPDNRFRVFYRIDVENHEVEILAIGVKEKERLYIGGEEVSS